MNKLSTDDLISLEEYRQKRAIFRNVVMDHKTHRRIPLGPNATLHFEDQLTMRYQVQEMLRAENIENDVEIQEELDTYNALIPDGSNWKATLMIEFDDEAERQTALKQLVGVENDFWIQVGDHIRVTPISDEDLERSTEDKTSAVHFLRFELSNEMIRSVKEGAPIQMGSTHPAYTHAISLNEQQRISLTKDLEIDASSGELN